MQEPVTAQLSDSNASSAAGRQKMEWARQHMPILETLQQTFLDERPLSGQVVGMAMHVEAKTAVLAETLAAGGAQVAITGCNPLSTQDDVSAALDSTDRITSYARHDVDEQEYYRAIDAVLDHEPTITIDDGMDMVAAIHERRPALIESIVGGCEETTTGVHRLRAMENDGALRYPVFAVNDTPMKRLFDNVHGTGESVLANIAMTTNLSYAGKRVVVAGFGDCGRGLAKKAAGQNATVIVTEVEPRRALEAHMEGYDVRPMAEAAGVADVIVTTTGNRDIVTTEHIEQLQDGVVMANAGHFDLEVDIDALETLASEITEVRDGVVQYQLADGRRVSLLAEGRLVNLAGPSAMGHPVEVMDQSFGVQAVAARELVENADGYGPGVHGLPDRLDRDIAEIKLEAEGVEIDTLSETQRAYMDSWQHGT